MSALTDLEPVTSSAARTVSKLRACAVLCACLSLACTASPPKASDTPPSPAQVPPPPKPGANETQRQQDASPKAPVPSPAAAEPPAPPAPIGAHAINPPVLGPRPVFSEKNHALCGMPAQLRARGWPTKLEPTSKQEPDPPASGTITIAVLPDTQYYADCNAPHFYEQSRWLADTAKARNTALAIHLGDITENNTPSEWEYAQVSLGPLLPTLPVLLATGNHDYGYRGRADVRDTLFARYFGRPGEVTARFVAESLKQGDVENAYYRLRLPNVTLGVLVLEWSPRHAAVEWANRVLTRYATDRVIVVTHAYLYHDGTRYDWRGKGPAQEWNPAVYGTGKHDPDAQANATNITADGMYDGQALWEALVSKHAGIFLTLNGHVLDDGVAVLESEGAHGNRVQQVLVNFQMLSEGGLGYLRLLELLEDGRTLRMKTYSPSLELFATHPSQSFDLAVHPPLW